MTYLQTALVLVFPALVVVAALRDVVSYTIPNWISLGLIAVFPLAVLATGMSLNAAGLHLAVGVGALLLGMGMFAMNWVGGGDAKLFAAAALWLGWPGVVTLTVGAGLAGGALTFLLLAMRQPLLRPLVLAGPPWVARLGEPGGDVPYGVAICAGALLALPASPLAPGLVLPL